MISVNDKCRPARKEYIMVAGHVREKKGYFYAVLNYTDAFGNRKTKWIKTGLPVKGNKKKAEAFLQEQRRLFVQDAPSSNDMLFADFMEQWLEVVKTSIAVPTYASYCNMVKKVISPYFREKEITLKGLTAKDIQDFYLKQLERVSAASVIHYHSNIHKALKYAVKLDLIPGNPADKVERPRKEKFVASFYDADEINKLFEIAKGTKLEMPILFGAFYGLRRSEAIGLKWDAIDFEADTITIKHTVTSVNLDGKHILVPQDTTKTKSSRRTLPLVPFVKERLLSLQEEQKENRRLCGRCYNREFEGYICVNEVGDLIKPEYVSSRFGEFLEENGMRRIRFHDLRHSCASLMLSSGVPMKQIQEWLGHSDFSTTANIYAHLEYSSKISSADAMLSGLGITAS
jgi:integrase